MVHKIYLDQNILSELQFDCSFREEFEAILSKCWEAGGIFVFSQVHVEECKASNRPEEFVQILERLGAYFLSDQNTEPSEHTLELGRARELILPQKEPIDALMSQLFDPIKLLNFAIGGLEPVISSQLLEEMASDINNVWSNLLAESPSILHPAFEAKRKEVVQIILNFPADQFRSEMAPWKESFRRRQPNNLAQLDQIPSERVIEYLVALLDEDHQIGFKQEFPRGFLREGKQPFGKLTGFALLFFALDLVRDSRTRTGDLTKRHQYFLGQFRDCQHIEYAARCDLFLTKDKGAARLARSVYCYADAGTEVWHATREKGENLRMIATP